MLQKKQYNRFLVDLGEEAQTRYTSIVEYINYHALHLQIDALVRDLLYAPFCGTATKFSWVKTHSVKKHIGLQNIRIRLEGPSPGNNKVLEKPKTLKRFGTTLKNFIKCFSCISV